MTDKAEQRILEGPLAREILRFGTPLAIGMFLQNTFNLVDAYLIAQLPTSEVGPAIGALGICDQIAAIGTILSYGVSTATSAMLTNQRGANKDGEIQDTAWQSILLVTALGVVFGIVGIFFAGPILRDVIGAKGEVAIAGTRYLRVSVGGSFSIFLLLQLTTIQRALGSAKTPVALLVSGNVINVFLSILMIFGPGPAPAGLGWAAPIASALHIPHMGMIGAAWATIFARTLVLVPNVIVLARRFSIVLPPKGKRGPNKAVIAQIAGIAWPTSAQLVIRITAMLLINSLVARYFTTPQDQTASTAIGVVFRLDTIALFIGMGWGSAAQTFVGQNIGAKNQKRAVTSGWITAAYDAVTNILLIIGIFAAGEQIIRIFDNEAGPVGIALQYLHIVSPSYIPLGIGVVLGNAMAGAGATRTTMWIDIVVILGFQFPVCILAVSVFGAKLPELFACVAATNVVSAIVYSIVYGIGHWKRAVERVTQTPAPPNTT